MNDFHRGFLTLTQSGHRALTAFCHQCDNLQHGIWKSLWYEASWTEWLCTGLIIVTLCTNTSNRINPLPLLMIDKDTRWRDSKRAGTASLQKVCAQWRARQFCNSIVLSLLAKHTLPAPAETGCCSWILAALVLLYIIMNSLDAMGVYGKKLCPSSVSVYDERRKGETF